MPLATQKLAVAPVPSAPRPGADDFRDHLSTADQEGRRRWLYPRKVRGRFYNARTWVSWGLLALMFAGPFVRLHGNPLLLINILERKFIILGQIFWPQDMFMFAVALLIFITGILVFTAAYGRLWCGWVCPQTVLMEMVFRKLEYLLEGDSHQQRALAKAPWSSSKIARKTGKHFLFFALSFLVGNTLLAYLIGVEQLFRIITDHPSKHVEGLTFMLVFAAVFYAIFARFREQACTFICPYGRFQSTVLDENTIVVAYDYKRGEQRRPWKRGQSLAERNAAGNGDCISCQQCVAVCPTGIDIRNGTQMECVHCTACIDACDNVMARIGRPQGLIRYASLNGIERGEKLKLTPRLVGYTFILFALACLFAFLVFTRSDVQTSLLRAQGALFQKMPDGHFSNLYTVRVVNKTSKEIPIQFKLENVPGDLQVLGKDILVPPEQSSETSILIDLSPKVMKPGTTPLVVGVYSGGRRLELLKTGFIGPRDDTGQ
jgi:cytochrome c oxidase accessory protein FixG